MNIDEILAAKPEGNLDIQIEINLPANKLEGKITNKCKLMNLTRSPIVLEMKSGKVYGFRTGCIYTYNPGIQD